MDRFVDIYRTRAADYHALIAAEDADGNLLPALEQIVSFKGRRVLDLGSGTGRIPLLLRGKGCEVVAVDLFREMLVEQDKKRRLEIEDWRLVQSDLRHLSLAKAWADVVTAGWAIGHFVGWFGEGWKGEAERALTEMARVAKAGGTLIILETMGTGTDEARPPTAGLAEYYAWLEAQGFERRVRSTDYDFGSVERAAELCGFFFGEELAARVRERRWGRVPEWTGIWLRQIP